MKSDQKGGSLKKELGLFDVFSVSTGAMFSSGFFLLPGLAAAQAGPGVILAYFIAGILILPAMFSACELSTALPRAGGAYYFLDRSLGPMVGTIGGLGTYLATTLKTAFALIGIGAYAVFFVDLEIKPVAVVLTGLFMAINIFGAKETTSLQRILVTILLVVLALFVVVGLYHVFAVQEPAVTKDRLSPFFEYGVAGLFSTVGFVFVSYAGLTKVASVAEEVKNPDRNIPLGMMLSLAVTSFVYVAGVFILVALIDPSKLHSDLTPVATAAESMFGWLPGRVGLMLVVISALAAFASTGNAGLLASSRYPLAMARDNLIPKKFAEIGRFSTPVPSILLSGALMVFFILVLDAKGIAKLASAFILFIFVLTCFAVIVMRESRISSYDPGYRSPFYPWMQIFGIISGIVLIAYMGWLAIALTGGVVVGCIAWYRFYGAKRVERHGAIYHWFRHLGGNQYEGLDREFRGILQEKGLRAEDPFEEIVARSMVVDIEASLSFEDIVGKAADRLSERLPITTEAIKGRFMQGTLLGETPVAGKVALPHFRTSKIDQAELVLIRSSQPIAVPKDDPLTPEVEPDQWVNTMFFLVSPEHDPRLHLRILAQIATRVSKDDFEEEWKTAATPQALREVMLRDDRFFTCRVDEAGNTKGLAGKKVMDLPLPPDTLLAMIRRGEDVIIPKGNTQLKVGDQATFIGDPKDIRTLKENLAAL